MLGFRVRGVLGLRFCRRFGHGCQELRLTLTQQVGSIGQEPDLQIQTKPTHATRLLIRHPKLHRSLGMSEAPDIVQCNILQQEDQ